MQAGTARAGSTADARDGSAIKQSAIENILDALSSRITTLDVCRRRNLTNKTLLRRTPMDNADRQRSRSIDHRMHATRGRFDASEYQACAFRVPAKRLPRVGIASFTRGERGGNLPGLHAASPKFRGK